jgi:hypothetical protein
MIFTLVFIAMYARFRPPVKLNSASPSYIADGKSYASGLAFFFL